MCVFFFCSVCNCDKQLIIFKWLKPKQQALLQLFHLLLFILSRFIVGMMRRQQLRWWIPVKTSHISFLSLFEWAFRMHIKISKCKESVDDFDFRVLCVHNFDVFFFAFQTFLVERLIDFWFMFIIKIESFQLIIKMY